MKLYFDTNVVLDILLAREPFCENSYSLLKEVAKGNAVGFIGASSITDIYYIADKVLKNPRETLASILNLLKILTLVDSLAADIWAAAELPMPDFEDATIAVLAKRNQVDHIVTRNLKDYALSPVPAISPVDCLQRLK
jgi:predicted nucleic acid-binding protein